MRTAPHLFGRVGVNIQMAKRVQAEVATEVGGLRGF
jgi:hypothetical protein